MNFSGAFIFLLIFIHISTTTHTQNELLSIYEIGIWISIKILSDAHTHTYKCERE
jgi:hypothetical protein